MKYSPLVVILTMMGFVACVKYEKYPFEQVPVDKYCSAYNNQLFQYWFPYIQGARTVFKDTMGDTRTLTIDKLTKSGMYKDTIDRCDATAALYAHGNLPAETEITFSVEHMTSQLPALADENNLTIKLYNQVYRLHASDEGYDLDIIDAATSDYYSFYYDRMNIGDNSYTSIYEFRSRSDNNIKSIFLAKRVGLLGFTFRDGHSYWVQSK
ncbi:MAG: hypothetical protein H6551_13055 [Chitinophagales bacterium]|nr:hypothetical protein [Chitinophagaceae bacterium]MCB9066061.1 hypothetical protein [Chitinophagales bacterium]